MMILQQRNIIHYSKQFGIETPSIMDNVEGESK
jgi:hypothetical protein